LLSVGLISQTASGLAPSSLRDRLLEIQDAARLTLKHRQLAWSFGIRFFGLCFWSMLFTVGLPMLVKQSFQNNVGLYGVLVAAYGIGNVVSNLVVSRINSQASYTFA
jgi:DHA3 family macrolide efflux protein-like MFS transporter